MNYNSSADWCSNGKLADLENYQDVKKCLKQIQYTDIVQKVQVALSELETCDETCFKCRRYYVIEFDYYVTDCEDEKYIEFFLCVEDNYTNESKKYFKIIVPIVLFVLFILLILIWYCRLQKRKKSNMVRAKLT